MFQRSIVGDEGIAVIMRYWEEALMMPWGSSHPAVHEDPSQLDTMVPLQIHYDGVEVYRNQEAHVWSFGSSLVTGAPLDVWFPIAVIMDKRLSTPALKKAAHR